MKDKGDKVARVVMAGIGIAAVELVTIPGLPVWVAPLCKIAAALVGAGSPSLIGIPRHTRFHKSASGGVDQAEDAEAPKK